MRLQSSQNQKLSKENKNMDAQYQALYKNVANMQRNFRHQTAHTAHDPMANILNNQMHGLHKDLATGKNPRTIENHLKMINRQLKQVQNQQPSGYSRATAGYSGSVLGQVGPILNTKQSMAYRKNFDNIRKNIRQSSNY